jgi:hypothetical protein
MEQLVALMKRNTELKFKSKILADAVMLRDFQLHTVREGRTSQRAWPIPSLSGSPLAGAPLALESEGALMQRQLAGSTAQAVHTPGSMRILLAPGALTAHENLE